LVVLASKAVDLGFGVELLLLLGQRAVLRLEAVQGGIGGGQLMVLG
jgi:hypothetical protein